MLSVSSLLRLILSAVGLFGLVGLMFLSPAFSSLELVYIFICAALVWAVHLYYEVYLHKLHNNHGTMDRERHYFLNTLSEFSPVSYRSVDKNGVICELGGNEEGFDDDDVGVGKSILSIAKGDYGLIQDHQRAMAGEDFTSERYEGKRFFRHYYFPSISTRGEFEGYKCISIDFTGERKLKAELLLTRQVLENTTDAIAVCDSQRRIVSVNRAFQSITGFGELEWLGQKLCLPKPAAVSIAQYREIVHELRQHGCWQGDVWVRKRTGEIYSIKLTLSAIRENGKVSNYLIFFTDITEALRTHEELRYLANHDFLTGLPNRRLFLDRVSSAIKRSKRGKNHFAVFFIDLDNFKLINDSLGHQMGDALLQAVAGRLQKSLREVDTVARLSGDEFTVIAENFGDNVDVLALAQKILGCFEKPFDLNGEPMDASASVGIAVYPEHGEDVESLIDAADNAMYKAKAQGRNGYFYLNDSSAGRFAGKTVYPSELRMAIQRDELELVYQPQVNLATGEVVGCEALLRWNHHSRGQLLPNEFLSIAEEKGMLSSIGNWVAHQACGQFNLWRAKGISFDFLAINIAAVQLDDALFLDGIREALEVNSLSPSMLSLEIPEHVAIADIAKTRVFIRRAAEMGLTCTIDDFGSTGESFHYMRELPVRMVKLDQKLLLAIKTGKETQILLKAVVALAEVLQLKIVGVGVERSLQEQTLEQLGCHYGQGYFYAKPMTAENFQAFFSANHKFSDGQWKAG